MNSFWSVLVLFFILLVCYDMCDSESCKVSVDRSLIAAIFCSRTFSNGQSLSLFLATQNFAEISAFALFSALKQKF